MSKTKVKNIYLYEGEDAERLGQFATGVVLKLEDGREIALLSSDVLTPYVDLKAEAEAKPDDR